MVIDPAQTASWESSEIIIRGVLPDTVASFCESNKFPIFYDKDNGRLGNSSHPINLEVTYVEEKGLKVHLPLSSGSEVPSAQIFLYSYKGGTRLDYEYDTEYGRGSLSKDVRTADYELAILVQEAFLNKTKPLIREKPSTIISYANSIEAFFKNIKRSINQILGSFKSL